MPKVAFDGHNYFITWTQFSNYSLVGRYFNTSGIPVTEPEVLFGPSADYKVPIGGVGFGGGLYLVVATKVDSTFSNGDVYGRFINPLTDVENQNNLIPEKFKLFQNYPNPFNPTTKIEFSIPSDNNVEIKVFNVLGMEVATLLNEKRQAGKHSVEFNASNLSSGVYFYKIISGNYSEIKKMILLR
ncbi:MAG: hypothetical protein Fur0015_01030 [Ignavibacteriales bacterium]